MPRSCSICTHEQTAAISKAIATGASNRDVARRYGITESSCQRHRIGCLKQPRKAKDTGTSREQSGVAGARRFESPIDGRCSACGTLVDDPKPEALVRRAERVLSYGEQIMQKAIADEDFRLGLAAIDRARLSLEQLLKVHGLLQPEGATVVVSAETMTLKRAFMIVLNAVPEVRRSEALELWVRFLGGEAYELPTAVPALPAGPAIDVTEGAA